MQQLNTLYLNMARLAFAEIRHLAFGRASLHQNTPEFPESVSTDTLLQNLFVAGQLAEAMHNLPTTSHDNYRQYLTLLNLCKFIEKNPKYDERLHSTMTEIIQLNYQELSEINVDFAATIADKYR